MLAAAVGGRVTSGGARASGSPRPASASTASYVNGGSYALDGAVITLNGNGRCDFVGYGAAIVANGTGTRLVVDGAQISNRGVVRTAAIADNGATLVVKNSSLRCATGRCPRATSRP